MKVNKNLIGIAALIGSGAIVSAMAYKKQSKKKKVSEETLEPAVKMLNLLSDITGTSYALHDTSDALSANQVIDKATTKYLKDIAVLPNEFEVVIVQAKSTENNDSKELVIEKLKK